MSEPLFNTDPERSKGFLRRLGDRIEAIRNRMDQLSQRIDPLKGAAVVAMLDIASNAGIVQKAFKVDVLDLADKLTLTGIVGVHGAMVGVLAAGGLYAAKLALSRDPFSTLVEPGVQPTAPGS